MRCWIDTYWYTPLRRKTSILEKLDMFDMFVTSHRKEASALVTYYNIKQDLTANDDDFHHFLTQTLNDLPQS